MSRDWFSVFFPVPMESIYLHECWHGHYLTVIPYISIQHGCMNCTRRKLRFISVESHLSEHACYDGAQWTGIGGTVVSHITRLWLFCFVWTQLSMLTRGRLRSLQQVVTSDMEEFTKYFLTALEDNDVVERFRLILKPSIDESLDPVETALQTAVKDLQQTIASMQDTIRKRDDEIQALRHEVSVLREHQDDLEQHSRRASVRVFGVPETTPAPLMTSCLTYATTWWRWNHPSLSTT